MSEETLQERIVFDNLDFQEAEVLLSYVSKRTRTLVRYGFSGSWSLTPNGGDLLLDNERTPVKVRSSMEHRGIVSGRLSKDGLNATFNLVPSSEGSSYRGLNITGSARLVREVTGVIGTFDPQKIVRYSNGEVAYYLENFNPEKPKEQASLF